MTRAELNKKLAKVSLLILDVDGVLTNGEIVVDDKGIESKIFNVQDGFGIVILRKAGLKVAIISARATPAVKFRAEDLKIDHVVQGAYPKITAYRQLLKELKLKDEHVCFIGDDLPDLEMISSVGVGITVPNGVAEVKKKALYVTKKEGGRGAVREVVEMILQAQGKWKKIVEAHS